MITHAKLVTFHRVFNPVTQTQRKHKSKRAKTVCSELDTVQSHSVLSTPFALPRFDHHALQLT